MDAQQAEFLGNRAFFNTLGDLMILRTFVEPNFNRNDAWRLFTSVTAALTKDFIIPPWPENLLPANVVPLPNDHDDIERLLSQTRDLCSGIQPRGRHAQEILRASSTITPDPVRPPQWCAKAEASQSPRSKIERQTHCSSSKSPRTKNWMSSPT